MEIWTGHDLDGDGRNDVYIGHRLPNDPTGFTGIFLLLFMGLFVVSFFFFASFDDKDGSNLMGTGIMTILGSATVAGLLAGRLCGLLRVSYYVPLGALGGFVVLGFLMVGMQSAARSSAEAAKRRHETEESARSNAIGQKLDRMRERGKAVVEQGKQALARRGWTIKDSWAATPVPKNPNGWRDASEVPELEMILYIQAEPPSPKDVTIEIRYHQDERKSMIQAYGSDPANIITQAHSNVEVKKDFIGDVRVDGYQWHSLMMTDLREFRPGTLRQLCSEMESSLKVGIAQQEKADREETQRQAAASAAAEQQMVEGKGNSRGGWVVGVLLSGVVLAGVGGILVWKSKRRATAPQIVAKTPVNGKPATNGQRYRYACSGCGARYKVPHAILGKSFRCKQCKMTCAVPMDVEQLVAE